MCQYYLRRVCFLRCLLYLVCKLHCEPIYQQPLARLTPLPAYRATTATMDLSWDLPLQGAANKVLKKPAASGSRTTGSRCSGMGTESTTHHRAQWPNPKFVITVPGFK